MNESSCMCKFIFIMPSLTSSSSVTLDILKIDWQDGTPQPLHTISFTQTFKNCSAMTLSVLRQGSIMSTGIWLPEWWWFSQHMGNTFYHFVFWTFWIRWILLAYVCTDGMPKQALPSTYFTTYTANWKRYKCASVEKFMCDFQQQRFLRLA